MRFAHTFSLFLLCFFFGFFLQAQTPLFTGGYFAIQANGSNNRMGSYQEFTIPSNIGNFDHIEFIIKGGDGGSRRVPNLCREKGGEGATVTTRFRLGTGVTDLKPGGMIRVIVGKKGARNSSNGIEGGGGGGGTAILYKDPGAPNGGISQSWGSPNVLTTSAGPGLSLNDAGRGWILLAVAGGGGGAYASGVCNGEPGRGGNASTNGSDGKGLLSGLGGEDGDGGDCGGGGIINRNSCRTLGGFLIGSNGVSGDQPGGFGYGAGAKGSDAGGGGGGYSGGGTGAFANPGGGGGSFANSGATFSQKTGGHRVFNSENGFVIYQFQDRGPNTPEAICRNLQVYLDSSGHVSVDADSLDNGSQDAFGSTLNFWVDSSGTALDTAVFDCADIGAQSLTLAVSNGLDTTTCVSIITVDDSIAPVVTCPPNRVVNVPATGIFTYFALLSATAADACPPAFSTINPRVVALNCEHVGDTSFYFTLTDQAGNAGRCTTTITVRDVHAPQLNCPSNIVAYTDANACGTAVNYLVSSNDACLAGISQIDTSGISSGDVFPIGTTVQQYVATDYAGNSDNCTFSVTVQDTTPPVVTCSASRLVYLPDSAAISTGLAITNSATDNCGLPGGTIYTPVFFSYTCNNIGVNTFSFSATDIYGNTGRCTTIVTLLDSTAPRLYCPGDIVVSPNNSNCSAATVNFSVTSYDYCGTTVVQTDNSGLSSGGLFPNGTTALSYRATDGSGNVDSCSFSITVQDTLPPVINCPGDTVLYVTDRCDAVFNYAVSSIDNCGGRHFQIDTSGFTSGRSFTRATVLRNPYRRIITYGGIQEWVAIDSAGNTDTCRFNVTVVDTIPPEYLCPPSQTIATEPGLCGSTQARIINFSVEDACSIRQVRLDSTPLWNQLLPPGTYNYLFAAFDDFDNSDTCSFSITVVDNEPPVIHCPNDTVVYSTPTSCSVTLDYTISATDNCGVIRIDNIDNSGINQRSPFPFPVGVSFQELVAIDASLNTDTCAFTVTVLDTIPPTDICPRSSTFDADSNSCGKLFAPLQERIWRDNCGIDQIIPSDTRSQADISRNYYPVGVTTQGLLVTDYSGNAVTCTWTRTIRDVTAPVLSCPSDTLVIADSTQCGTVVDYPLSAYDACGYSLRHIDSSGLQKGDLFPIGMNMQSIVAEDSSGNSDTCIFRITVEDRTPPVVSCEFDSVTVFLDSGACVAVVPLQWSITDNCGAFTFTSSRPRTVGQHIFDPGHFDGTFYDSCITIITVLDTTKPVIHCPSDTVVAADITCGFVWNYQIQGNDDCTFDGIVQTDNSGFSSGDNFPVGTTVQSYLASDSSGNTATCSFNITVNDTGNPTITCPSNITVNNDPGVCGAHVTYAVATSDNCSGESLSQTVGQASQTVFPVGTTTNTFVVTDASGNTAACSFDVTVIDNEPPVVICQDVTVYLDSMGFTKTLNVFRNGAFISQSDNCSTVGNVGTTGPRRYTCNQLGARPNFIIQDDPSGNQGRCRFNYMVVDSIRPTAVCQNTTVFLDSSGLAVFDPIDIDGGSTDNCSFTLSASQTSFGCSDIGTNTVVLTVTDASGNTDTCSSIITVRDSIPPAINCPTGIAVTTDSGLCAAIVHFTTTSSDNCSSNTSQLDSSGISSGGFFPVGTTMQSYRATDAGGNTTDCSFTVTVSDTTSPVIVCPANITVSNDSGVCGAFVSYPISSTDNCSVSHTQNDSAGLSSGSFFPVGTTLQHWTAVDASGNTTSCSFTILVDDEEKPSISIGSTSITHCQFSPFVDPGFSALDHCDGDLTNQVVVSGSVNWNVPGTYFLHYDVADASGNVANRQTRQVVVGSTPQLSTLSASVCPGSQLNIASLVRDYSMLSGLFEFYADGALVGRSPTRFGQARYPVFQTVNSDTSFTVVGTGANGCTFSAQIIVTIRSCASTLAAKALLEGAYDTTSGRMHDGLRNHNLVPITEPYSAMGYQFIGGGGEVIQSGVLATTGSNAIVDWVVIELRDSADPRSVVHSRSALLQADGDIVETDGVSTLRLDSLPTGSYYLVIWHRNHLAVMTAQPLHFDNSNVIVDFSDPNLLIYGSITSRKAVNGTALLFGGDADHNGQVQNTDNVMEWIPSAGTAGYKSADFNMDGQVQNSDLIYFWLRNAGRGSAVPR